MSKVPQVIARQTKPSVPLESRIVCEPMGRAVSPVAHFRHGLLESMRMQKLALSLALVVCASLSAKQPVRARKAMVIAQEPIAADAGLAVLKAGGNAVGAAVAVGFALAVTHPFAGNIGGGGFIVYRETAGRVRALDYREMAPGPRATTCTSTRAVSPRRRA